MSYDPTVEGAHCHMCPLKGNTVVPPAPAVGSLHLIIVGEGPGRTEEKMGAPFVGMSGKVLDAALRENDFTRTNAHVTNAALCRGDSDKDNERAAVCCAPRLLREVGGLSAKAPILTLGKAALHSVLGTKKLFDGRGFLWTAPGIDGARLKLPKNASPEVGLRTESLRLRSALAGRCVVPSIHPAFVLRADTWKPIFQIDINRAVRASRGDAGAREDEGGYEVVSGLGITRALRGLGPVVSLDVETDGIDPLECGLLCVGVSDGANTVVIWPWKDSYAGMLGQWLRTRSQVAAHNGFQFDQIVLESHGVSLAHIAWGDTLLAHHSYASHLPQRLSHCVASYCDAAPWKIKYGKKGAEEKGLLPVDMDAADLVRYNAADCRLTSKVWERLQNDLEPERGVYEHDLALAKICQRMTVEGIGVDLVRREELHNLMKRRAGAIKGKLRALTKNPEFSPARLADVRAALFTRFRARLMASTPGGMPSTNNATLEALRGGDTRAGHFADWMLKWREVTKSRNTYVDAVVIGGDGRAHFNWKPFGTVSGRLSCRLQSCPKYIPRKWDEEKLGPQPKDWEPGTPADWPRELYVPRKGNVFVYFDVSQAEMRFAAYLSRDVAFMKACEGDVHANNAKAVFPEIAARGWLDGELKKTLGKKYRDIAKNLGFAIAYGAEAEKVFMTLRSKGFDVSYKLVELILSRLRTAYRTYYRFVDANVEMVRKQGYMRTPILGRIRWLGWYPKPTDVSNFPVQSALADVMNARMIAMALRLPPGVALVAQIHDACIYDTPRKLAGTMERLIADQWAEPVVLAGGALTLPVDLKRGERWSEL